MGSLFQFDEATHTYLFGEQRRRVPSVTQILKGVGIVDYSHIPADVLNAAADRGTRAHLACQFLLEGTLDWDTVADDIFQYVRGCEKFLKETGFKADAANLEHQGVHTINGMSYGYRWDAVGEMNGMNVLLDFKCTANEEKHWGVQLAAYDLAAYSADRKIRKRFVLRLLKDGGYRVVPFADVKDYEVFKWALGVQSWKELQKGGSHGNECPDDYAE